MYRCYNQDELTKLEIKLPPNRSAQLNSETTSTTTTFTSPWWCFQGILTEWKIHLLSCGYEIIPWMAPIHPSFYGLLCEQESILNARQRSIFIFLSRSRSLSLWKRPRTKTGLRYCAVLVLWNWRRLGTSTSDYIPSLHIIFGCVRSCRPTRTQHYACGL